jgi:hypothetical protein
LHLLGALPRGQHLSYESRSDGQREKPDHTNDDDQYEVAAAKIYSFSAGRA